MPIKAFSFITLFLVSFASFAAETYVLPVAAIATSPKQTGDFENYVGKSATFELTFVTPEQKKPTDTFTEPPFYIRNLATGKTCQAGEKGGIWKQGAIYRTLDDNVLILGAFSGSSRAWEFYDAKTCKLIDWVENLTENDPITLRNGAMLFKNGLSAGLIKHLNIRR